MTTLLSLPVDIPWRRLATSEDMFALDPSVDLPVKWRSSLAIFYFAPQPDPNQDPDLANPDELVTFVKIVATVTGFQPDGMRFTPHQSSTVPHHRHVTCLLELDT